MPKDNTLLKDKILLITHTDLDGIGCSILVQRYFENFDIMCLNYNEMADKILLAWRTFREYDKVIISDLSIPYDIATMFITLTDNVVFIDHHMSSLKYANCFPESLIMTEYKGVPTCGTDLLSIYLCDTYNITLQPQEIQFIKLVRSWDTWAWVDEDDGYIACQLNDLLSLKSRNEFITDCLEQLEKYDTFPEFSTIDAALLAIHEKRRANYIQSSSNRITFKDIGGYTCGIVFADEFVSILGNSLCTNNEHIDIAVMVSMKYRSISFRTIRDDIDLSEFASKYFGGGGHRKAAGAELSDKTIMKIINIATRSRPKFSFRKVLHKCR